MESNNITALQIANQIDEIVAEMLRPETDTDTFAHLAAKSVSLWDYATALRVVSEVSEILQARTEEEVKLIEI